MEITGLNEDEIKFLLPEEVFGEKKIDKKELTKRSKEYIYYRNKLYTGKDISKFLQEKKIVLEESNALATDLQGEVAYKTNKIVKGKVRIIYSVKDINKVKRGDILVTSMTMPNFLPAMKKASAFVTDEGGVGSHASILSREMKKPCIVGTKHATSSLKDGDEVEVDTEKGTVRKIKN